uniref:Procollagen C-endopeptidase enhancer n=1 Tax=Ictidomys tridecemlineatus TaxID=43179 RepID=A0A287D4B4_ICTTR
GESGYVASEGFPNLYPPNKECIWTITVPEGQTVSLSFRVFDLELHPSCRYDALEVFAGSGTSGQRLGRFCGTFRPAPLVAPGNQVTLRMTADEGTGGRGFLLWYSGRATSGTDTPSVPCPKQCRRTGTLQSNFCASDLVVTATVKSMVRGPGEGLTVTVSLIGAYKTGGLDLPSPPTDTPLKFYVPCRPCPLMKKGLNYLIMGQVDENRGPIIPSDSFVVQHRPSQDQILTNLSKRKCSSQPRQAAESQA